MFSLAVSKSIEVHRNRKEEGVDTPNILVVLLRDSIFYFGGVMTVIVTNMFAWALARVSHRCAHTRFCPSILTLSCLRILSSTRS